MISCTLNLRTNLVTFCDFELETKPNNAKKCVHNLNRCETAVFLQLVIMFFASKFSCSGCLKNSHKTYFYICKKRDIKKLRNVNRLAGTQKPSESSLQPMQMHRHKPLYGTLWDLIMLQDIIPSHL